MPASNKDKEFTSYVVDLMQAIGPVSAKRMFGGYGIFLKGVMFGIIVESVLYLKTDKDTENEFKARGLEPFTYTRQGKEIAMSYYQAPEESLEDGEEMNSWASKAYKTALKAASKKTKEIKFSYELAEQ